MEVRPGYKQTEVGLIPDDWGVARLSGVCSMKSGEGITSAKIDQFSKYPCYGGNGLRGFTTNFTHDGSHALVGRQGALCGNVLGVEGKFFASEHAIVVTSLARTDIRWLTFVLEQMRLNQYSESSAQPGLSVAKLLGLGLALPPTKAEQEAIALALSDANAVIESLKQLLLKQRQLKQGVMQELLAGRKRLPGFTAEWKERTLFELAGGRKELFDDGDWIESEHITDEGVRLVQTGNIGIGSFVEKANKKYIFENSFVSLRCKEIRQGDLLICRLADPAGRSCVLPDIGEAKIVTSVDVTIFRPPASAANRVFLANMFSTDQWFRAVSDRSGGTTHKRISRGALGRLTAKVPSIDEQTAIAVVLSDMDSEIATLEEKLSKARDIKQGMMQELLTGTTRLIEMR